MFVVKFKIPTDLKNLTSIDITSNFCHWLKKWYKREVILKNRFIEKSWKNCVGSNPKQESLITLHRESIFFFIFFINFPSF